MAVPDSVEAKSSIVPLAEDVVLKILGDDLPEVTSVSLVNQDLVPPFILVRQSPALSVWGRDNPFVSQFYVELQVFTYGTDADVDGPKILNAVDVVLKSAASRRVMVYDGLGWLVSVSRVTDPRRRADWADSEGPVQYADLPSGYARFTSTFRLRVKRAVKGPFLL